jgi:hypothetical protein
MGICIASAVVLVTQLTIGSCLESLQVGKTPGPTFIFVEVKMG